VQDVRHHIHAIATRTAEEERELAARLGIASPDVTRAASREWLRRWLPKPGVESHNWGHSRN
jgi:hypothetical protein